MIGSRLDDAAELLSNAIDRDSPSIHDMMRHIPGFAKAGADARAYANRGRTVRGTSVGPAVKNTTGNTIRSKMRISDSNRSKIGSIMEEYESAYRTGEIVDSWTETVQRRSGCGTRDRAVSSGTGAAGQTNALDVRAQERDDAGDPAENSGAGRGENRRKFSLKSADSEERRPNAAPPTPARQNDAPAARTGTLW